MKTKVIITGAGGFIGSYLMSYLSDTFTTIGTVRDISNVPDGNYIAHDWAMRPLRACDADVLIHTAARNPSPEYNFKDYYEQNVLMMRNVIQFAKDNNVKKVIYMAAVSSFGRVEGELTEQSPHNECDDYGLSKYVAEKLLETSGVPYEILILPGVVGPKCRGTWLFNVAKKIARNEDINCFNANGLFNNVADVGDIAKFISKLAQETEASNQKYLLGATDKLIVNEVLDYLKEQLHSKSKITELPSTSGAFVLNTDKAVRYGFVSKPLKEILGLVCNDYIR